jgi:ribosomal protein S12 methylthiotransferase
MRRPQSKDRIYRLIERLRTKLPDCALRTTLIVGFPGETGARFNELLEFVKWAKFDNLGCFTFYPEKGAPAAKLPQQIPDHVKKQRLEQIMLTQQQIAFEKNKSRIGNVLTCLVDSIGNGSPSQAQSREDRTAKGRFFGQSPEIDPVCIIKNCSAAAGTFVQTKVTGTRNYDLLCEQI